MYPLNGYPASELPLDYVSPSRTPRKTIDLSLLQQDPPNEHLVGAGDVLGIYIQGVLGDAQTPPPIYVPADGIADPSLGYPIRVDTNGTISLPMLDPLPVAGLTMSQTRQMIRRAYTQGNQAVLQPGRDHIHVTLQKPRTYRVIVIREEAGNPQGNRGAASVVNFETEKRGTGRVVDLPAHRNDVMNALARTGGLPGLDAETAIYVIRGQNRCQECQLQLSQGHPGSNTSADIGRPPLRTSSRQEFNTNEWQAPLGGHSVAPAVFNPSEPDRLTLASYRMQNPASISDDRYASQYFGESTESFSTTEPGGPASHACQQCLQSPGPNIIRIPLKVFPGEPLAFGPEDVILNDGDIVLVENRVTEFFYTAGLLRGGQYAIPRDYDIGVMDAIALAESQLRQNLSITTIGNASVLNQDVSIGASRVIIQRKMSDGSFLPIKINLYDVMKHPAQQILIRPEDRIILRYTRCEAMLAWFERFLFDGVLTSGGDTVSGKN